MSHDDRYWDEIPPKPKQENTLETFLKKWIPEANPPQRKLLIDHVEGLIKEARIEELKKVGCCDYWEEGCSLNVCNTEQLERIAELEKE